MLPDLSLDIVHADTVEDVLAIASLYPGKSAAEREEMICRSLVPNFVAMTEGQRVILLARHDGDVVGTVQVVWENPGDRSGLHLPGAAVIHHLRTRPGWEGRGIGRRLLEMARILARCRGLTDLTLGVEPNNQRALRLYRAMGYQTFHRYRGKDGETIIGMRKMLSWQDDP